jgi:hypothetical protein
MLLEYRTMDNVWKPSNSGTSWIIIVTEYYKGIKSRSSGWVENVFSPGLFNEAVNYISLGSICCGMIEWLTITERHFFKSVREIPRQKEAVKILAAAYICRTCQVSKFDLETNKARE